MIFLKYFTSAHSQKDETLPKNGRKSQRIFFTTAATDATEKYRAWK